MFRELSRLFQSFRVLLGWTAEGVEKSIPLRESLAADRRDKVQEFLRTMELADEVGAGAKLLAQDTEAARVACRRLESALKGFVEQAKKASERGDQDAEALANARGVQIARELARTRESLSSLEAQLEESMETRDWAKDVVIAKALRLQQLKREDTQLVAQTSANQLKRSALKLQQEMLQLVPEEDGDLRARAKDRLRLAEARTGARFDLLLALKGATTGPSSVELVEDEEGARLLEKARSDAGYAPSAESVPALTDGKG